MHKIVLTIAIIIVSAFVLLTAYIAVWNWNDKILSLLMTGLIVGTATAFTTIIFTLKEEKSDESFTTAIAIDDSTNMPFNFTFINPEPNAVEELFEDYHRSSFPEFHVDGKKTILFKTPKNPDEVVIFSQELLQFSLMRDIASMQQRIIGQMQNPNTLSTVNYQPKKFKNVVSIPLKSLNGLSKKNRFFLDHNFGMTGDIKVPRGTTIDFSTDTSEKPPGFTVHRITLRKRNFFEVKIDIECTGDAPMALPSAVRLQPHQQDKLPYIRTYLFNVRLQSHFEKFTSGNEYTDEYKAWVKWIFENLKRKYGFVDRE